MKSTTTRKALYAIKITFVLAVLSLAVVLAAPAQARADSKNITLNPGDGGTCEMSSVTLDENGKLPSLPTPSKAHWTFEGWCTAPVTYERWGSFYEGWDQKVPAPVANHPDGHKYEYEDDYWTWLAKSDGEIVREGQGLPDGVTELHACYKADSYTITFKWNGWGGRYVAMDATRAYDMPACAAPLETWTGHTFKGWYTSPKAGEGEPFDVTDGVKGDLTVYAHYSDMAENPEDVRDSKVGAFSVGISPRSAEIKPNGGSATLTASLTMHSSTTVPSAEDWKNVKWAVIEGSTLVDLSGKSGHSVTVTSKPGASGSAKVQASFLNESGKTVTSDPVTITIKDHVHTYGAEQMLVAPTCSKHGIGRRTCTGCGDVRQIEHAPIPHTYKTVTEPATCTKAGSERTVCTMCGHTGSTRTLARTGHDFVTRTIGETCVGTALQKTCRHCGFIETIESGAAGTGHSWETRYTVDKPATCGAAGSESQHCSKCGMTRNSREIPATGSHVFGGWHTTKVATPEAKGERARTCATCGEVETEELSVLVGGTPSAAPADNVPAEPVQDVEETPEGADAARPANPVANVRVYNPSNGEHLFVGRDEADDLEARGWSVESAHVTASHSATPVYRLYNEWSGEHHYTTSTNELATLEKAGWQADFEGAPAFYSDDNCAVKVYRLWNGQAGAGSHHYTTEADEYARCLADGWQDEGIGWYYVS